MKNIEKSLLLSMLIEIEEDIEKNRELKKIYEENVKENSLIKRFNDVIEKYDISGRLKKEIDVLIYELYNEPTRFGHNIIKLRNISNNIEMMDKRYQEYLNASILYDVKKFDVVDKFEIKKYEEFNIKIYKLYLYKKVVMEGEKGIMAIKKYVGEGHADWLDYYTNVIRLDFWLNWYWCICMTEYNDLTYYEVVYFDKPFLKLDSNTIENKYIKYASYNESEDAYYYNGKRVVLWGSGNIVNFNYNQILDIIDSEIMYHIAQGKDVWFIDSNPNVTLRGYIGEEKNYCISPEEYAYILNKYEQNKMAQKRIRNNKCIICGADNNSYVHRICVKHVKKIGLKVW